MQVGDTQANHRDAGPSYIPNADPGRHGGGTYTSHSVEPTLEAYENIFGPSARDIKQDLQRFKRHGRWHLPDILKGPNQYLTDRIDGLITDATNSPFTSRILPYKYITNVDGKIKWNVWSFDEGLASRVPYESAARTLQQSKRSYAGYTIRQGMAIVLEHNFMMTDAGRENFKNQLNQLIGSIQLTNDLDVHVALVLAPSYQKTMSERYMTNDKSATQICREFVDMFGFVQKNQNALDILIEEAKAQLRTWGAPMPDFMLVNSKLTFQLTMTPDATNYVTQGPEGPKRLKAGPVMQSYRGIGIVHSKAFSMETGTPPRDILRRRVRVAEYYRILPHRDNHKRLFQLYNEERDTWSTFTFQDLLQKARCAKDLAATDGSEPGHNNDHDVQGIVNMFMGAEPPVVAARNGPHHGAGAPGLGVAFEARNADDMMMANLTELYRQIFTRKLQTEFFYNVQFVDKSVVYVPGAMDFSKGDRYDDINNAANIRNYPPFIKKAMDGWDRRPWDVAKAQLGKIQIQSVAPYPRDVNTFIGDITDGGARFTHHRTLNLPEHFIPINSNDPAQMVRLATLAAAKAAVPGASAEWQAFDATRMASIVPAAAAAAGDINVLLQNMGVAPGTMYIPVGFNSVNQNRLRMALAIRNYNRYGVPTPLVRQPWGANGVTFDSALVLSEDTTRADFPHLDQVLRDRGAFNCPNHFKERNLPFRNLGDLIGYNVLLSREFVTDLTVRSNNANIAADPSIYQSTFLYDIVFNNANHGPLIAATVGHLNTIKARMAAAEALGAPMTRSQIADALKPMITAALALNRAAGAITFNQQSRVTSSEAWYWLWPRTTKCEEEVFSERNTQAWATQIRGMHEFTAQLTVTDVLVTNITTAGPGFPTTDDINLAVPLPAGVADATAEDALNFYRMLAWRLWADQEIPLQSVYQMGHASWPYVHAFLSPQINYAHAQFGVGTITFGYLDPTYGAPGVGGGQAGAAALAEARLSAATENVEIVIVRPNIEHHMLGIILGQGGESLGSTFWGQTELSCYDDSMHGIWGMSYKYNERAIVINERNLVRLWDVAYDGYVGGKEDSAVEWNNDDENRPNSRRSFDNSTMDVTRNYRGPSMMVMAFNHADARVRGGRHTRVYKDHFQSNWPSPIVFYDTLGQLPVRAAADFDNVHVVEAEQFRVFNNPLYRNAYRPYQMKMPNFQELHSIRKNAGLAATENEASSEALAFQGTMRVLSGDGMVIDDVKGSGHHGPDFVGCASLRAGKGYKINSQPTIQRLV